MEEWNVIMNGMFKNKYKWKEIPGTFTLLLETKGIGLVRLIREKKLHKSLSSSVNLKN